MTKSCDDMTCSVCNPSSEWVCRRCFDRAEDAHLEYLDQQSAKLTSRINVGINKINVEVPS